MEVTIKNFIINLAKEILGGDITITVEKEATQWRFTFVCDQDLEKILTVENGRTLFAFQHIIRASFHQKFPESRYHFIFDLANFRKNRENIIIQFIPNLVNEVIIKKGKTIVIKSLSGYERLLIHTELKGIRGVQTMSFGVQSERKLIILPTSETGTLGLENSVVLSLENLSQFLEDEDKDSK